MNKLLLTFLLVCVALVQTTATTIDEYIGLLQRHCHSDYKQMYRDGKEGAFKYPFIVPGSKSYSNVLWDWDSWLSDVALRQILNDVGTKRDKKEALAYEQGCVLNYLYYTDADGYMPMVIDSNTDPRLIKPKDWQNSNMHKPVIAQHAALIIQQNDGDASWLKDGFGKMKSFMLNYATYHKHAPTGLYYWQNDLAIGVDNDPSTFYRPKKSSASIYLNCLMYRELLAMAYIAERLGSDADAVKYTSDAEQLKASVRKYCWDEKDGMYYSVDLNLLPVTHEEQIIFGHPFVLHEGAPRDYPCLIQRFGVWSGFMAMWAGIATPEQAQRMTKENLLDERTFCAPYGVRTMSKLEKMYNLRATHNPSNWQGPVWGISNYMVFRGLVRYGLNAEARMFAEKTITLFGEDISKNSTLHEYYNPDTGEGIINPDFQNWDYLVLNIIAWYQGKNVVSEF